MLENIDNTLPTAAPPIEAAEVETQEQTAQERETAPEREFNEVEKKALEKGWVPKDQYTRTDKEWVDAKDYLRYGEFMEQARQDRRRIRSMEEALRNTQKLIGQVADATRRKTIEELTQQKREAIQSGDVERTEYLEKEIYKHNSETPAPEKKGYEANHDLQDWMERNQDWFNVNTPENARMRKEAAEVEAWIREKHKTDTGRDLTDSESLAETERYMRKKYSLYNRGENQRKYETPAVESNTPISNKTKKKYNASAITDEMRKFARDFVKHGVYKSEEEYFETLQNYGVIK